MPLACEYCGLFFWNTTDQNAHVIPCVPGVAPGSTTVGVPPGETSAPDPLAGDPVLPPDTAAQGLKVMGA
jgi:hypothetical protein